MCRRLNQVPLLIIDFGASPVADVGVMTGEGSQRLPSFDAGRNDKTSDSATVPMI